MGPGSSIAGLSTSAYECIQLMLSEFCTLGLKLATIIHTAARSCILQEKVCSEEHMQAFRGLLTAWWAQRQSRE